MKDTIINIPLAQNKYSIKCPNEMIVKGITIHETDNNASARNEISYMQSNNNQTSFHFAVDEIEVLQGLPLDRNSWNAGDGTNGFGNRQTLSVEICRNYNKNNSKDFTLNNYYKARSKAEELTGYLMSVYKLSVKDLYMHKDFSGKNCPRVIISENYWETFKKNAQNWKDKFDGKDTQTVSPKPTPTAPSIKVGDKVKYSGYVYSNSMGDKRGALINGEYKVTIVNNNPYGVHLEALGWVKESDCTLITNITPNIPKGSVKENGVFTSNETIIVREQPNVKSKIVGRVYKGNKVNYDYYYVDSKYVWIHNKNNNTWLPWRIRGGEKWGTII